MTATQTFHPPARLLLGPGPSNVEERVLRALAAPPIGYFDAAMPTITGEISRLLREAFGTANPATFPLSGTGTAGMEAALVNLLEPGETAVIGRCGYFGDRMVQIVERVGAVPVVVEGEWGRPLEAERLEAACARAGRVKLLALVHAETSTGVLQPLEGLRALADRHGALLLLDAVTSLGGHPVELDRHGVDACYAGTQKALSAPTGLAPLSLSPRALEAVARRRRPVASYYLDAALFAQYWQTNQVYHHTPPISFYYALLEALRILEAEGLAARFARHRLNHRALVAGLEAMGLRMLVEPAHRLWTLNAVRIPEGVDDAPLRARLVGEYGIEIGGGLGALKGTIWRVGLMGVNATPGSVLLLLAALERLLPEAGFACGSGVGAAQAVYAEAAGR